MHGPGDHLRRDVAYFFQIEALATTAFTLGIGVVELEIFIESVFDVINV